MSRRQTAESDEGILMKDMCVEHAKVSTHKLQPSAKPKADLRLVVLGGDAADNSYACSTILRYRQREETINPLKDNIGGREVSVFRTPSYWMEHLASHWFFTNGLESIRHEVQNCTSILFPGPHAFLLVMRAGRAPGKEHYLLRALTSVFGAEALEYTMVIFIHAHEQDHPRATWKERCLQMCGGRFHTLEDSDENVEELLTEIEMMTKKKKIRFFVQRSYENVMKMCFESWERSRVCKKCKQTEETEAKQQQKVTQLTKQLETLGVAEKGLRKDLGESALRKEQNKSNVRLCKLQREVEEYKQREKELQQKLKDLQSREELLRDRLEQQRSEELQIRERQLDHKERELMAKEQELEKREREFSQDTAVRKSEEETAEPFEARGVKPARRNSREYLPPKM